LPAHEGHLTGWLGKCYTAGCAAMERSADGFLHLRSNEHGFGYSV
jgi:hypothetical protein